MAVNFSQDYKGKLSKGFVEDVFRYSVERETLFDGQCDDGNWRTFYLFTYTNGERFIVCMLNGEVVMVA